MVSPHDQMAIQWARSNCTVESNQLKSEKHLWRKKYLRKSFFFILLLDFIVHLLLFQA